MPIPKIVFGTGILIFHPWYFNYVKNFKGFLKERIYTLPKNYFAMGITENDED